LNTYGCLIKELRLLRLGFTLAIITPFIEMLLKFIIAVSVTQLIDWPVFSIFAFNFVILLNAEFVIYFVPYQDKYKQATVAFNSVCYLVLNYHLFLFTDFNDTAMFPQVSNSVIVLVWLNIGINLLIKLIAT